MQEFLGYKSSRMTETYLTNLKQVKRQAGLHPCID
jgi:hypothetical protein